MITTVRNAERVAHTSGHGPFYAKTFLTLSLSLNQ